MIKKIIFLLLIILISLFQISFIGEFSFLKNYLNLVLVIIIILSFFSTYSSVLVFGFLSGLIMDLFSIYSFGLITIAFLLTVFIINLLFKKLITNKETYSLVLVTVIGTITFNSFLLVATNLFYIMDFNLLRIGFTLNFLYTIIWQILIHSLVAIVILISTKFIDKKLMSKFLLNKK